MFANMIYHIFVMMKIHLLYYYMQILSDTYTTDHGGLRHHHHHDDDEEDHEHVFPISRKPGIMGWENIFN